MNTAARLVLMAATLVSARGVLASEAAEQPPTINAMCPIGKEPIVPSAGTVEYKGHAIGLCCPSCGQNFLAWDDARKDDFLALAMKGAEPGHERHGADRRPGDTPGALPDAPSDEQIVAAQLMHYPIDTCIVSGEALGSMGDPLDLVRDGRLVRLCCAGCVAGFEKNPEGFFAALDAKIIEHQVEGYPLDTCVVSGAKLGSMGEPVNHIHQNRLVRFCCAGCIPGFDKSPAGFMAALDAAYADAHRDEYPLDTCVVSGAKLGSMGDPVEIVAGTTLVRFCCGSCLPRFHEQPEQYLAKLRAE